jgi:hypothetical protein
MTDSAKKERLSQFFEEETMFGPGDTVAVRTKLDSSIAITGTNKFNGNVLSNLTFLLFSGSYFYHDLTRNPEYAYKEYRSLTC